MSENNYSPLLPKWKVKLIQRRALRMGFRRDEIDDVQQQIVPHVMRFDFDPAKANGAREQTALVALIDQQLKAMARAQPRYRRHVEQLRQDLGADGSNEDVPATAICDEPGELVLDVQLAVAALPPRERAICTALGEGRSMAQIAHDLGCNWHTVRRVIGDAAILRDLQTLQIKRADFRHVVRSSLDASCKDLAGHQTRQQTTLARRQSEIQGMLDRLLNAYLGGTVDEGTLQRKSEELKRELSLVNEALERVTNNGPGDSELAVAVFDFSQEAAETWQRSTWPVRRQILSSLSLNRTLSDTSLCVTKRKPFDLLAEGLLFGESRGDCTPAQTGVDFDVAAIRPALAAFAEELSQPVLQIPFIDDLMNASPLIAIGQ